jgi:hypothetical protein
VRYRDPRIQCDVWTKATKLLCYSKIADHYDNRVPPEITPRLPPERGAATTPTSENDTITIIGVEPGANGEMLVSYRVNNEPQERVMPQQEMTKLHRQALLTFLEETLRKTTE